MNEPPRLDHPEGYARGHRDWTDKRDESCQRRDGLDVYG
jgi:hypothetical protein